MSEVTRIKRIKNKYARSIGRASIMDKMRERIYRCFDHVMGRQNSEIS